MKLSCALKDLTIPVRAGEHAAVQGSVLGASEDGSSVYVVAKGVLAVNENSRGETAQSGQDNLYGLHYRRHGMDAHVHRGAVRRRRSGLG